MIGEMLGAPKWPTKGHFGTHECVRRIAIDPTDR